uniref:Uncharacterized protein n=1 Tax=Lotus japonicus TaxID=34305 RepID=I3SVQ7_LOTJA|nr:unknown [Lotus japonicus]
MASLCGAASVTFPSPSFPSHKISTTKSSFVGFQLPLPKLSSSSIRTHFTATLRVHCQQETSLVTEEQSPVVAVEQDPRFMCVELSPDSKARTFGTRPIIQKLLIMSIQRQHGTLSTPQTKFLED